MDKRAVSGIIRRFRRALEKQGVKAPRIVLSAPVYEVFEPIEAIALTPQEWENGDSLIADFARTGEALG